MGDRKLTLSQVSSSENAAYGAGLMLFFAWARLLAIGLYVAAGGKRPQESTGAYLTFS